MAALDEILAEEGGMALNKQLALHLFQQLRTLHDWGQALVMGVLARYTPEDEDEVFALLVRSSGISTAPSLAPFPHRGQRAHGPDHARRPSAARFWPHQNILDDRLKHANASVVMAAAHLFLQYTANMDAQFVHDVCTRIKGAAPALYYARSDPGAHSCHSRGARRVPGAGFSDPLLTLLTSGGPELAYAVLAHLHLLDKKHPSLLEEDFKAFFLRCVPRHWPLPLPHTRG